MAANISLNLPADNAKFAELYLAALCIWRESRGETYATKRAVAWSIKNRVLNPGWWGHTLTEVVTQPYQYSSFNRGDPNSSKFPFPGDPSWTDSLAAASEVFLGECADPTGGAHSYFDRSLDKHPPSWSMSPQFEHTVDVGAMHFFRRV